MIKARQKLTVRCFECTHTWVAAHLPMSLEPLARILEGSACPMCGERNRFNHCELTSSHENEGKP